MSVINPRNRLVNFRLSEAEFEQLKEACFEHGARSVSEFARTAVLGSLDGGPPPGPRPNGEIQELDRKVSELEIRVEQLLRLIAVAGTAPLDQVSAASRAGELRQI